jgi:hypothetical protein
MTRFTEEIKYEDYKCAVLTNIHKIIKAAVI